MAERRFSRGFMGRRRQGPEGRLPPGQYVVDDFPVLTAGPTQRTPLEQWDLTVIGGSGPPRRWSWQEFRELPTETFTVDIHCVTRWSKLDTTWEGVSLDTLLEGVEPRGPYLKATCDGGYTTAMPTAEVTGRKAWVAFAYDGAPLAPEHGGPARLLVPGLYLWKSAKWVRRLELIEQDEPGFWESLGYHAHGDPWKEERQWGD